MEIYSSSKVDDRSCLILIGDFESRISEIKIWMNTNKLMLNDDNTGVMLLSRLRTLKSKNLKHNWIGESTVKFSNNVNILEYTSSMLRH